jgi:preprotein translocase subunit YajC
VAEEEERPVGVAVIAWLILLPAGLFYFLLWRPQQRRMAAAQQLQIALEQNDEVMTTSGIYGRITRLGDDDVDLEIAPGTVIRIARGAIGQRITGDTEADDE